MSLQYLIDRFVDFDAVESFDNTINNSIKSFDTIEHFGMFGSSYGNKVKNKTSTAMKSIVDETDNMDRSTAIKQIASLMSTTINKVVSNNKASLLQALAASNQISISGVQGGGDFVLTGIKQTSKVDLSGNANFVQTVKNDITTQITNEITNNFSKIATDSQHIGIDATKMNPYKPNAAAVLDGSAMMAAGNKTLNTTVSDTETMLKSTFNLNDSFKLDTNNEFNNVLENQLSTENLQKCAQETQANNALDLSNISIGGDFKISDLKQENFVTAALSCAFNQEVLNNLATIYLTNMENLIESLAKNTNNTDTGDIYTAGAAGALLLTAAPAQAAMKVGNMDIGAVEATEIPVEELKEELSGSSNMWTILLICCCVFLLIGVGAAVWYYSKNKGGASDMSTLVNSVASSTNTNIAQDMVTPPEVPSVNTDIKDLASTQDFSKIANVASTQDFSKIANVASTQDFSKIANVASTLSKLAKK
jgi:hypothetical protein